MKPWRGWFHCMANTYGTWLPGDARGFRTRHHREHVEGDYKDPPPSGMYEGKHEAARRTLSRQPVILAPSLRPVVLQALRESLQAHGVEVLSMSVGGMHLHLLARFPVKPTFNERGLRKERTSAIDDPPRHFIGIAKQWSSKQLMRRGVIDAPLWARRGKIKPVADRAHQLNAYQYILDHALEGAAVWSFRERNTMPEAHVQ